MLQNYSRVRLLTEKFQASGAALFDVGYIIEVYSDGDYEVEFSDKDGTTTAQIVVREEDIQLAEGIYEPPKRSEPATMIKERLS